MQPVCTSLTCEGVRSVPTLSSPTEKPLSAVACDHGMMLQYTMLPGASTGAMPSEPLDPSASPVSMPPP
jgi:hypothetical protein